MILSFHADPSTTEWLSEKDAALCVEILRLLERPTPRVLEIGVWKGAWTVTMAGNIPDSVQVGIDPYPGGADARAAQQTAAAEIERHGFGDRVRIVDSWETLHQLATAGTCPRRFDLVHIDGRHTQDAAARDLEEADRVLADDGVIVVDDYRHPAFPGVAFAMYRFLEPRGFRLFLTTENKAYLARLSSADRWYRAMEHSLAAQQRYSWCHHIAERWGGGSAVTAVPDILGAPVLLCFDPPPAAPTRPSSGKQRVVRLLRNWLPPVAFRALIRGWTSDKNPLRRHR